MSDKQVHILTKCGLNLEQIQARYGEALEEQYAERQHKILLYRSKGYSYPYIAAMHNMTSKAVRAVVRSR